MNSIAERWQDGIWEESGNVPWQTRKGISYRELAARSGSLLDSLRAMLQGGASPIEHVLLADKVGQLNRHLEDLATVELAVTEIYRAGGADERRRYEARHARRRGSLRLLGQVRPATSLPRPPRRHSPATAA